jgi:hypothetical protein
MDGAYDSIWDQVGADLRAARRETGLPVMNRPARRSGPTYATELACLVAFCYFEA